MTQTGTVGCKVRWSHWWSMWLTCIIEQSQVKLRSGIQPSGDDHERIVADHYCIRCDVSYPTAILLRIKLNEMSVEIISVMLKAACTPLMSTNRSRPPAKRTLASLPSSLSLAPEWHVGYKVGGFSTVLIMRVKLVRVIFSVFLSSPGNPVHNSVSVKNPDLPPDSHSPQAEMQP